MDQKKAGEIYDYIEEHQDDTFAEIAKVLNITERQVTDYALLIAAKPRGEFIFYLTKQDVDDTP